MDFNGPSSQRDPTCSPLDDENDDTTTYEETDGLTGTMPLEEKQSIQSLHHLWQYISGKLTIVMARPGKWNTRKIFPQPLPDRTISTSDIETAAGSSRATVAYLDGLRGVAALSVLFTHTQEWAHESYGFEIFIMRESFGYRGRFTFACFPGIRNFFAGGGGIAISLFYIMSGYVLSNKSHRLIAAGELDALARCVSSAIFRRWFRLFVPIFIINFLWVTSYYMGAGSVRPVTDALKFHDSYMSELHRLFNVMTELSSLYGSKDRQRFELYNPPMWTIPAEFQGSVVVYLSMLAFAHFTPTLHLLSEVVLWVYFLLLRQFQMAMFVSGMILCHVDTLNRGASASRHSRFGPMLEKWPPVLWYALWLSGLYIAGLTPDDTGTLYWGGQCIAAILIMIAVPRIGWVKALLESRFCQFLGRISYALYLTHLPVLWIIGGRIFAFFGRFRGEAEVYGAWGSVIPLPGAGPMGLEINTIVPSLFFFLLAFGTAHLATRFIDEPSVQFAQWLYRKGCSCSEKTATLPSFIEMRGQPVQTG